MRRVLVFATLLLIAGVAFYFRRSRPPHEAPPPGSARVDSGQPKAVEPTAGSATSTAAPGSPTAVGGRVGQPLANASTVPPYVVADFPIVAALNAPDSTIARDLDIVQQLFDAWLSNFPREGNPVGENADITAALRGENRLGLALVPQGHPALNSSGELCDRWGTPFRFHQLSGTKMEVRSAGADRRFGTADDATWTPQ